MFLSIHTVRFTKTFQVYFFVVMDTRGQSRHRRALDEELCGIPLRTKGQTTRFRQLKAPPMKSTKWVCPTMLNHLGIGQEFHDLANAASLQHFIFQRKPTYRQLTLEFLSTLKHTVQHYLGSTKEREWTESLFR